MTSTSRLRHSGLVQRVRITRFHRPTPPRGSRGGRGVAYSAGIDPSATNVYFTAGVQPRELVGPRQHHLLRRLPACNCPAATASALTYGRRAALPRRRAQERCRRASCSPLVNPDGVPATPARPTCCASRTRNPASAVPGTRLDRLDINRNYDFFGTSVPTSTLRSRAARAGIDNPRRETFHGTAAFPSRIRASVTWVFDQFHACGVH